MDESVDSKEFNPLSIKKGTQFMVMLVPVEEADAFAKESKEETLTRFRKRMNALIGDIASIKSLQTEEYRESIKKMLRDEGKIIESTNELSLEGLATVIIRLTKIKNESTT